MNNPRIGFVSLGCPKALVDSERIITQLRAEGYETVPTHEDADLVVVNTCGFIDAAIEESFDAIEEALDACGKVVVTGCLGARKEALQERYPELISVSGPQDPVPVVEANGSPGVPRDEVPLTDVSKIYGRIQFVDAFPDYTVEVVDAFPDLRVQKVRAFADAAGKWQIVQSFPDFKIQKVRAFGDFKVQFVTSFPGAHRH